MDKVYLISQTEQRASLAVEEVEVRPVSSVSTEQVLNVAFLNHAIHTHIFIWRLFSAAVWFLVMASC